MRSSSSMNDISFVKGIIAPAQQRSKLNDAGQRFCLQVSIRKYQLTCDKVFSAGIMIHNNGLRSSIRRKSNLCDGEKRFPGVKLNNIRSLGISSNAVRSKTFYIVNETGLPGLGHLFEKQKTYAQAA